MFHRFHNPIDLFGTNFAKLALLESILGGEGS